MNGAIIFILSALQITLLDIVLSGDNVGVIALAIRKLNPKDAKLASMIGVSGAIVLRIVFACIVTIIMSVEWLPIKLIGGFLLMKITWNLIRDASEDEDECKTRVSGGFWKAVFSIILADVSMSLDNVLAIGGAAHGNIALIIMGIAMNIPIIFFGSQYVSKLMRKYKLTIYIGGAILIHTSMSMIIEDRLVAHYFNHYAALVLPWVIALVTLLYGVIKIRQVKISKKAESN